MIKSLYFSLFILALPSAWLTAADPVIDARKAQIVDTLNAGGYSPIAYIGLPAKQYSGWAHTFLWDTGGTDSKSLDYFRFKATGDMSRDAYFIWLGITRGLYLGDGNYSPEELNTIREFAINQTGFNSSGTENHRAMTWTSAYLYGQYFNSNNFNWGGVTMPAPDMMERALERYRDYGWNLFNSGGFSEHNSPIYSMFHLLPALNMAEYATDENAKAVGEAIVMYHMSLMALCSFEGHMLAPWSRAGNQRTDHPNISQLIHWHYFGTTPDVLENFVNEAEYGYVGQLTSSDYVMPDMLLKIGRRTSIELPYTVRATDAFFGWSGVRTMRSTYQADGYALSTGGVRHSPGAFALDDSKFALAWTSTDAYNYVEATHPYWRSDRGEDYWKGRTSPFMQQAHHENTAIILFNIPSADPWAGVGQWANERDDNGGNLLQVGQLRWPKTTDEVIQNEDFWFLREGDVYTAIQVLKPDSILNTTALDNFDVLKSYHSQTGFIIEVGRAAEFSSFEVFQTQVQSNPVNVDWANLDVSYTDSQGDLLRIRYNTSLVMPDGTLPEVWANGELYDWENWPALESPHINLKDGVLSISGSDELIQVDWSGAFPGITRVKHGHPFVIKSLDPTNVDFECMTVSGKRYQIRQSTDLINWENIGSEFTGNGGKMIVSVPFQAEAWIFYGLAEMGMPEG